MLRNPFYLRKGISWIDETIVKLFLFVDSYSSLNIIYIEGNEAFKENYDDSVCAW